MNVKLLTEQQLEFLSLKEGCTDSSESTLVEMPHCWKSHVMAGMGQHRILVLITSSSKKDSGKESKGAKIRNRYNQVSHLTQDTNGKVTNLQLDTTNENQEVSPFPAGDHKAHINRCSHRDSKHKTDKT